MERQYCFQSECCGEQWTVSASLQEISNLKPACPSCRKQKTVFRDFQAENVGFSMPPTTVGSLADRNSNHMSEDEKIHRYNKNNEYRNHPYTGILPEGASTIPVDNQGKRLPDKKQKKRPPRS